MASSSSSAQENQAKAIVEVSFTDKKYKGFFKERLRLLR